MLRTTACSAAIVATALLSTTGPAAASTDNFVEFQISTARLSEVMRARFAAAKREFCPLEAPCPSGAGTCVIDHFDVGGPGTFSRASNATNWQINSFTTLSAQRLVYEQQVTVFVQTLACSEDPACNTLDAYDLQTRYELLTNQDGELCVVGAGFTPSIPGVVAPPVNFCFELKTGDVSQFTGDASNAVSGAAISMNAAGTRVGVRIELDRLPADYDAARLAAWSAFAQGSLHGSESSNWSLFVHKSIFAGAVDKQVTESVLAEPSVNLVAPITTTWTPHGAAGAEMSASVATSIASSETPCSNDIGVDIGFDIDIHENLASNGIETVAELTVDPSDSDAAECAAQFGPLGFALTPLIGLGVVDDLVAAYAIPQFNKEVAGCVTNGAIFTCDMQTHPRTLPIGFGVSVTMTLAAVFGSSSGLSLSGPMSAPLNLSYDVNVTAYDLAYALGSGCYASSCSYQGGLYIYGNARLCGVEFTNDPLNVYEVNGPAGTQQALPVAYEVGVNPNLSAQDAVTFNAAPYPLYARVSTSEGVETYEVSLDKVLTQGEAQGLCMVQKTNQAIQCFKPFYQQWRTPPEMWVGDFMLDERMIAMKFIDPRRRIIDMGIATNLRLDVQRGRFGEVTSAALVADARSRIGSTRLQTVPLSIPISIPSSARFMTNEDIARNYLNQAFVPRPVARSYLPTTVSSADMELEATTRELMSAVLRGMR